jgi:hypothetical protein
MFLVSVPAEAGPVPASCALLVSNTLFNFIAPFVISFGARLSYTDLFASSASTSDPVDAIPATTRQITNSPPLQEFPLFHLIIAINTSLFSSYFYAYFPST